MKGKKESSWKNPHQNNKFRQYFSAHIYINYEDAYQIDNNWAQKYIFWDPLCNYLGIRGLKKYWDFWRQVLAAFGPRLELVPSSSLVVLRASMQVIATYDVSICLLRCASQGIELPQCVSSKRKLSLLKTLQLLKTIVFQNIIKQETWPKQNYLS